MATRFENSAIAIAAFSTSFQPISSFGGLDWTSKMMFEFGSAMLRIICFRLAMGLGLDGDGACAVTAPARTQRTRNLTVFSPCMSRLGASIDRGPGEYPVAVRQHDRARRSDPGSIPRRISHHRHAVPYPQRVALPSQTRQQVR